LTVGGPLSGHNASVGLSTLFAEGRAGDGWAPTYVLHPRASSQPPVRPAVNVNIHSLVALIPGARDVVQMPDVPPGIYQLSKEVSATHAGEAGNPATVVLATPIEIVSR
jgi:hypothetical protein